jgi:hypothetical protein
LAFALLGLIQHKLRRTSIAGLFVALVFLEGGIYQTTHAMLLLALVLIPTAIADRDPWPLYILGGVAAFGIGFGAIKLLPTYAFLLQHPRPTFQVEYASLHDIWVALFDHSQSVWREALGNYAFFEGGAYVGYIFTALVAVGAITAFRSTWKWLLAAAILFFLSMGDFARYAPWTLLHMLPIFSSQRVVMRLLIPLVLCFSVVAAYGVEFLDRWRPPWTRALAALVILAGAIDCFRAGPPNLSNIQFGHELPLAASPAFKQFGNLDTQEFTQNQLRYNQADIGIAHCYEYTGIPTTVVGYNEATYKGEQHLLDAGSVQVLRWSPNALTYQLQTNSPTTLVINQNYDNGWAIVHGKGHLVANNGLLAVEVPAGTETLKLVNLGNHLLLGLAITMLTAVGAVLLWRWEPALSS